MSKRQTPHAAVFRAVMTGTKKPAHLIMWAESPQQAKEFAEGFARLGKSGDLVTVNKVVNLYPRRQ